MIKKRIVKWVSKGQINKGKIYFCFLFFLMVLFMFQSEILAKKIIWGSDPFKLAPNPSRQTSSLLSSRQFVKEVEIEQTLFGTDNSDTVQKAPKIIDQLKLQGVWAFGIEKKAYISGTMYQVGDYVEDLLIDSIKAKHVILKDKSGNRFYLNFSKMNYNSKKIFNEQDEK